MDYNHNYNSNSILGQYYTEIDQTQNQHLASELTNQCSDVNYTIYKPKLDMHHKIRWQCYCKEVLYKIHLNYTVKQGNSTIIRTGPLTNLHYLQRSKKKIRLIPVKKTKKLTILAGLISKYRQCYRRGWFRVLFQPGLPNRT